MNCDICPHMRRIRAALAPCQTCDAGRLGGTCHVSEARMDYAVARSAEAVRTAEGEGGVTNLAPEDEDKLRRAMATLFGLDPVDLLMVQHLFQRKQLADFGETLIAVAKRIAKYKGAIASRSMSHAKKDAIARIFPMIAPIFKRLVYENTKPRANVDGIEELMGDGGRPRPPS